MPREMILLALMFASPFIIFGLGVVLDVFAKLLGDLFLGNRRVRQQKHMDRLQVPYGDTKFPKKSDSAYTTKAPGQSPRTLGSAERFKPEGTPPLVSAPSAASFSRGVGLSIDTEVSTRAPGVPDE